MTKMRVDYQGGLRTRALHEASGAEILTDAPKDNQGKGEAFSPTDLLSASLASCMLTIMGIRARALGLDMQGTRCEVEKVMQASPRKVAEIKIKFVWGGQAPGDHEAALREAALTCPVYLSLDPAIKKTIEWPT